MKQYRQGDILLVEISKKEFITNNMTVEAEGILALGEATGHSHVLDPFTAKVFVEKNDAGFAINELGVLVEVCAEGAILRHQEHGPIQIARGFYRRIVQREYTPEGNRSILD